MGSLSEDELQAMEGKARKLTILDLKKRALAAKQGGDIETAKECLRQAKKLEVEDSTGEDAFDEDEPPYSSTLPLFWKKVALLCKQAGDIDRAKQALVHSKEMEAAELESAQNGEEPPAPSIEQIVEPDEKIPNDDSKSETNDKIEDLPPPLYEDVRDFPPPPPPAYNNLPPSNDNLLDNCQIEGANEEEAAMLAELMGGGSDGGETRKVVADRSSSVVRAPSPAITKKENHDESDADSVSNTSDKSEPIAASSGNDIFETKPSAMAFTDEELMDEEMMLEFSAGGAQGIPTQEQYAAKVLTYKRLALKFKQEGNIAKATQNLRFAKQLEKVALALKQADERLTDQNEDANWLESLDPEESELLGELMGTSQSGGSADIALDTGSSTAEKLTIDDLEEMDDDNDIMELVEMMGTSALPTVEEVTVKITEEKQKALKYKQEGNIEMAKASLVKSKKVKLVAMRLAEIYRKLEAQKNKAGDKEDGFENKGDTPVSMEALEALMNGADSKPKAAAPPPKKREPPKDPWLLKPSIQIKAEVIRLKNEKNVKEASRLLQLFKQKLAEEQKEIERVKVAKMTSSIQTRLDTCITQRQMWQYYQWFGKETGVGGDQYREWTNYEKECQKAKYVLETEGSASVTMIPRISEGVAGNAAGGNPAAKKKLYMLQDDVTSLVESCTNETTFAALKAENSDKKTFPNFLEENTLEVAILGLYGMEENEKLLKILAKKPKSEKVMSSECPDLRIQSKLQLPIQPEDPSKPYLFDLEPSDLSLSMKSLMSTKTQGVKTEFAYGFDPSSDSSRQQVPLPRKDPKHERTLLRRVETKTLQLSVFYLHNQNKRKESKPVATKKKSWFFGRGEEKRSGIEVSSEAETKDIFLGKVTIDLKPLLSRGCLCGDYPVLVNSKAIGGILRVCLRTRPILDPDRYEGIPWKPSDGAPASLSISTYKKGLSFTFPNENHEENQSIETIKRESASISTSS